MRRLHRWLPAFVATAAVATGLLTMRATPTAAHHSWGNYHWGTRDNTEFTLQVGDNVSSAWDSYLNRALSDWSASAALNTTYATGASNRRCSATSGRVEVCNNTYGYNGWLGLAQIWLSGDHITAGTAKMNDTYFNTASYNTPAWRHFVMCQEVGHTFGLGHVNETFTDPNTGSCMDYTNDPSGTAGTNGTLDHMHPNQHDLDQLVTIYGPYSHTDSTTTVGTTATRGQAAAPGSPFGEEGPDNPADFGRPLGPRDQHGRSIYFVRDLGGGRRLLTHVYWVRPHETGHDHHR